MVILQICVFYTINPNLYFFLSEISNEIKNTNILMNLNNVIKQNWNVY